MDNGQEELAERNRDKPFVCDKCDRRYKLKRSLAIHNRRKHLKTVEKKHKCPDCDWSFYKAGELRDHRRIHTGECPFMCELCPRRFRVVGQLNHHKKVAHGSVPYKCSQCSREFAGKSNLDRHLLIHKRIRPHRCPFCDKSFRHADTLNDHILRHIKEADYPCPEEGCPQSFYTKRDLRAHGSRHQDDPTFICRQCDAKFMYSHHLNLHRRKEHNEVFGREIRRVCPFCQEEFSRKDQLEMHIRGHIREKPYFCRHCGKCLATPQGLRHHEHTKHRNQ